MYKSHVGHKISQCGLGAHCVSNIKEVDLCVLKTKSLELEHSRILTSLYHGQRANVVKVPYGRLEGRYDLAHGSGTFHPVQGFLSHLRYFGTQASETAVRESLFFRTMPMRLRTTTLS